MVVDKNVVVLFIGAVFVVVVVVLGVVMVTVELFSSGCNVVPLFVIELLLIPAKYNKTMNFHSNHFHEETLVI